MNKFILIFFGILSLVLGCYSPPSREIQNQDYFSLTEVSNTSDRVLKLKRLEEKLEFQVEGTDYVSFKFVVIEALKGSSKKDDKLFVTFSQKDLRNLYVENNNQFESYTNNFQNSNNYIFFLMGRAKNNTFPKELGGSLWFKNGNPSLFQIKENSIKIIVDKKFKEKTNDFFGFSEISTMNEQVFIEKVGLINE